MQCEDVAQAPVRGCMHAPTSALTGNYARALPKGMRMSKACCASAGAIQAVTGR